MYNLDSKGGILYLGEKSSTIAYDAISKKWNWFDSKNNNSIATSSATYNSLLIGVHEADFSGVTDDKCYQDGTVRRLKFTTCTSGQFTCNGGQCIDIEKRCDLNEDCNDFSDEENCQLIHMKGRYKKDIARFSEISLQRGTFFF